MGAGSSVEEIPGGGTEGYHVLRVQDNSPGYKAGLEPFFDFIVAIENTRLDQDNESLKEILKANAEKPVKMIVYSSKTCKVREASITPSNLWGGQGLLGVSIRFCSFEGANENVWHVLEIQPNSPADIAGFRPFTDYIIGADSVLHETEDLFALIESHEGKPLKLYVYNSETDGCREVTLTPNRAWGGEGSIGCGIGYGYLHRIPLRDEANRPKDVPVITPASASDGFSEVPLMAPTTVSATAPAQTNGLDIGMVNLNLSDPTIIPGQVNPFAAAPTQQPGVSQANPLIAGMPTMTSPSSSVQQPLPYSPHKREMTNSPGLVNEQVNTTSLTPQLDPGTVSPAPAVLLNPSFNPSEQPSLLAAGGPTVTATPSPLLTDITAGAIPSTASVALPSAGVPTQANVEIPLNTS
ncbi:Golgi reassembly-stacking protein 2-like [Dendronephthya gigantea]|uniref:Golgi reassembly-stacking protein 2-like n=1 Tax=Dendronephthya gigantea TaxID=151771 RepID=UPI00106A0E05|nr:Golgi reassembly-stacking protein 2-like [Dendronephthya gigantea]